MPLFRGREPSDEALERFTMPSSQIRPHPVPRVVFLLFALVLGFAFAGVGIGTELALNRVDAITKKVETRSLQRDEERDKTTQKIADLEKQLDDRLSKDHQAVCTALRAVLNGKPQPDPILLQLAVNYGC